MVVIVSGSESAMRSLVSRSEPPCLQHPRWVPNFFQVCQSHRFDSSEGIDKGSGAEPERQILGWCHEKRVKTFRKVSERTWPGYSHMGCSLMGVSKVFLRHVAPTRYGDQTLSAGEHLAAGFSQWRLALAAWTFMYGHSDFTWESFEYFFITMSLCYDFLVFSVFVF